MALNLIIGKPGAGKSYFAVLKISEFLLDWCRKEIKSGVPHERQLYTNLKLNVEEINKFVTAELHQDFDATHYIHFCDSDFFYTTTSGGSRQPRSWWDDFPEGALIVIDEVHEYIPARGIAGGQNFTDSFTVYVSQHRHRGQDLFFITQHTDTVHKNVLCMAEGAFHVCNVKTRVIPWLGIPFADIDVVKEAFGIKSQIANVIYGNYLSRSFKREGTFTIALTPKIYALYSSHMRGNSTSDRPSLDLSRLGALLWFARRHFLQLTIKAVILGGIGYSIYYVLATAPQQLSESLGANLVDGDSLPDSAVVSSGGSWSPTEKKTGSRLDEKEAAPVEVKIFVFAKGYIVTDKGRVNVGQKFFYEGGDCILDSIDFVQRSITWHRVQASPDTEARPEPIQLDENPRNAN